MVTFNSQLCYSRLFLGHLIFFQVSNNLFSQKSESFKLFIYKYFGISFSNVGMTKEHQPLKRRCQKEKSHHTRKRT